MVYAVLWFCSSNRSSAVESVLIVLVLASFCAYSRHDVCVVVGVLLGVGGDDAQVSCDGGVFQ